MTNPGALHIVLRVLAVVGVLGTLEAGCAAGSSRGRAASTPLDGVFTGDQVSFTVSGAKVGSFFLTGIQCSLTNEDPDHPEHCSEAPPAPPATEADLAKGAFLIVLGELTIQGAFDSSGHAKGVWTFRPTGCCLASGTCCVASGSWDAWHTSWQDTHGPPDTGTVAGSTPDASPPDASTVVPPPDDDGLVPAEATAEQKAALGRVNWYRANVGVAPIEEVAEINLACQAHADYYATHLSAYQKDQVPGGVHSESAALTDGFTGVGFGDRMTAAGYTGQPGWEIIAFLGSPAAAVDSWMETVYHRIPIVSPNAIHLGYGIHKSPAAIDVMDFGRGSAADKDLIVVYPWPDQTGVPRAWSGNEGPQPPAPKGGYPSGPVVTVTTGAGEPLSISEHALAGPDGKPIAHVWHPKGANGFMEATWALYAEKPLSGATKYTVTLTGTLAAAPWSRSWSFTTGP